MTSVLEVSYSGQTGMADYYGRCPIVYVQPKHRRIADPESGESKNAMIKLKHHAAQSKRHKLLARMWIHGNMVLPHQPLHTDI